MEQVSIWNSFTKGTETRNICTTDWEVVPYIDYPTAKKRYDQDVERRRFAQGSAF